MPKRKQAIAAAEATATRFTAEIGRSGLREFGGAVHEEFDADLRGLNGIKVYEEMRRNDPTIAVGLRAIGWLIGQVNWSVEPGGETREDAAAAAFLDSCLHDMSHTWSKVIRDALTCLPFGWAWSEMVMKVRNGGKADPASRYDDGRIGWRKFTMIGQDSLSRWEFDESGGVAGLWQIGQLIGGRYSPETLIPIDKSVLFRLDDEKNNPDGVSLLRPVFNAWYAKKQIQEVEAIGIERDLTGTLIIHMPVGATSTDYSKARDLVEQFKADDMAGFIAPRFGAGEHEGWSFEIISSPGSKSIDPDKAIQRYQLEIARSFLAQFLLLGQGGAGSWALARDQRGIFEVALGAILMNFDETINRFMVPPLFRLNDFGKLTALPQIKPGRISKADMDKFSKGLAALATAGLLTPDTDLERYVREEMDLPERVEIEGDEEQPEEDTGQDEPAEAKKQREPYQLKGGHAGHGGQHAPHTGGKGGGGVGGLSPREQKEAEIRNSPAEHSVVFDADGNVVVEVSQGNQGMVTMGPSEVNKIRATKNAVAVHNHPEDAPPSPNDFQAAWGMRTKEIKIVSPEHNYTVSVDKYQTWEKLQKASQKATQKLASEQVARMRKGESLESVTRGQSDSMHKILSDIVGKVPGVTYTRSKP